MGDVGLMYLCVGMIDILLVFKTERMILNHKKFVQSPLFFFKVDKYFPFFEVSLGSSSSI